MKQTKRKKKNQTTKKSDSLISSFVSWFSIGKIAGIASIISLIIYICLIWPSPKIDKLKMDIVEKVQIIKTKFQPEKLVSLKFNHPDVGIICEYQQAILQFVCDWETYESIPAIYEYENKTPEDLENIIIQDLGLLDKCTSDIFNVFDCIDRLLDYGNKNGIALYIPNKTKWLQLMDSGTKWKNSVERKVNKCTESLHALVRKYGEDGVPSSSDIKNAIKPFDDLRNDIDNYQYIHDAVSYFIELNNYYELQVRKYSLNIDL